MSKPKHPLDDLDRPRSVRQLYEWLRRHGETISKSQLYRYVEIGLLPVVRIGDRGMRTTARAYFEALTPKVGPPTTVLRGRDREKQASRDEDRRALAAGEKSRDDLRAENGAFAFPYARHVVSKSRLY